MHSSSPNIYLQHWSLLIWPLELHWTLTQRETLNLVALTSYRYSQRSCQCCWITLGARTNESPQVKIIIKPLTSILYTLELHMVFKYFWHKNHFSNIIESIYLSCSQIITRKRWGNQRDGNENKEFFTRMAWITSRASH